MCPQQSNRTTENRGESEPAGLVIRLFGEFELRYNGLPLPRTRTRTEQWLLALLLLRHPQPQTRADLAGLLWLDSDQTPALRNLRRSLSNLRTVLGTQAYRLVSPESHTISIDMSGAYCDVHAFRAAIKRGDAASLQQAADLYRGPLLTGCTEEWALRERDALAQAHLDALETLGTLALQAEAFAEAASRLRRVVAIDPYRETAQQALMRVLAAGGDPVAAMLAYRQFRLLLHEELRTEPAPETRALFERLRGQSASRTRASKLAPAGAELRAKLHVPQPLSSLVGREGDIEDVGNLLVATRLLTLTGSGGVGKTRLAIAVAEKVASNYADGAWFVDLAVLAEGAFVPQVIAKRLDIREEAGRSPLQTLSTALAARDLLLILDNCEHLLAECARLIGLLLQSCPGLRVLATSRQPLGLAGEMIWRVPSLALPTDEQGLNTAALLDYDATRLFLERALETSGFMPTDHDASSINQICRRLDGIPLALELAAARVKVMSPEQVAARLDRVFTLLGGGNRAAVPRQQTLRALIDWSYDLLTEPERVLLRRLSVFVGSWTLEAAESVCCADEGVGGRVWGVGEVSNPKPALESTTEAGAGSTLYPDDVLDLLSELVDRSLVQVDRGTDGAVRYRLLETIRQYAGERLQAGGEFDEARRQHQDWYVAMAEEAEPQLAGSDQDQWLRRLEAEHDNVRAALAWGEVDLTGIQPALRLAGAFWKFWHTRGHFSEGRERLGRILGRDNTGPVTPARAKALIGASALANAQGDYAEAQALAEESLTLYKKLGDSRGIAGSLSNLAAVAASQGDYVRAQALYEESLTLHKKLGHKRGIAISLSNLGFLARVQGDYACARALLEESLTLHRELGDNQNIAFVLNSLGVVADDQEDYTSAQSLFEESLNLRRKLGDRSGISSSLNNLAGVVSNQGNYALAQKLFEECLAIDTELGDRQGIAISLNNLGIVAYRQGDYAAACELSKRSLSLRKELKDRLGAADTLERLAAALLGQNEVKRAVCLWAVASLLREAIGAPMSPDERKTYDQQVAQSRSALGEEAFAAAWEEGRSMDWEQAVASLLKPDYLLGTSER